MIVEQHGGRSRRVYMSIAAQADNLGDIAIRQAAIDLLSSGGQGFIIYTGSMPSDYVDAFKFPADVELVADAPSFIVRYLGDIMRRRAHLVFAPGPLELRAGARAAIKATVNLLNILAARFSGGHVIAIGRALRGHGSPALQIERAAIGWYSLFVSRDSVSEIVIGRTLEQAPDLAFLRAPEFRAESRDKVAISLRGDHSVNPSLITDVVNRARAADLTPVFVTQVARDDANHQKLAKHFGADIVSWDGTGHGAQIARVQDAYRTCRFVVSDRLHALILGSIGGAKPIALRHPDSDKLSSTLADVLTAPFVDTTADRMEDVSFDSAEDDRLASELSQARSRLIEIAERLASLLR
ncbi:polysaccharide pyruvyl transferase family protein [Microbacterium sp. ZXX196]|uniref:polysaccharide pyruvyl transferase family protein n=1 Tax=Microbacterium sp. ZXX196 TaxID=2609291 RepID=UPI0012B6E228|nr:polysaccharide pyruvyl transferase family protein [Microbacterium sp. ZXX196]MTE23273.1 hypothetical protein [Microbacterium sp. ZXX196]